MGLKYIKQKKKLRSLDKYVIFSISALLIYTILTQIITIQYDVHLDTLTTCFFAAFGGEILSACLIKIFKLKKSDQEEPDEESKEDTDETFG